MSKQRVYLSSLCDILFYMQGEFKKEQKIKTNEEASKNISTGIEYQINSGYADEQPHPELPGVQRSHGTDMAATASYSLQEATIVPQRKWGRGLCGAPIQMPQEIWVCRNQTLDSPLAAQSFQLCHRNPSAPTKT